MSPPASAEFHCWYAGDSASALEKGRFVLEKYSTYLRPGPVVDLGCGEGALLLALKEAGYKDVAGVELNPELCAMAESFGLPVIRKDLKQYCEDGALRPATYFYIDVIEHVSFDFNLGVFAALPLGSRVILQTPNTESVLGHQFYMNVPSHQAPYSPWVIRRMLARLGYDLVADGTVDGEHPRNWKNRLRALLIRKGLGIAPGMILGGGNYFAVADHTGEADGN